MVLYRNIKPLVICGMIFDSRGLKLKIDFLNKRAVCKCLGVAFACQVPKPRRIDTGKYLRRFKRVRFRDSYRHVRKDSCLARQHNILSNLLLCKQRRGFRAELPVVYRHFAFAAIPVTAADAADIHFRFSRSVKDRRTFRHSDLKPARFEADMTTFLVPVFHLCNFL